MVTIRSAVTSDSNALTVLGSEVSEFSVNANTVDFWPKHILERAIDSSDVFILVAEDGHELIGFIIASFSEGFKKAIIENIFVHPKRRGEHIGEFLLERLEQDLIARGCEYITTLIPEEARSASTVYKVAGFSEGNSFLWLDKPVSRDYRK